MVEPFVRDGSLAKNPYKNRRKTNQKRKYEFQENRRSERQKENIILNR